MPKNTGLLVYLGIGAVAYFAIVIPFLESLNLMDTKEEKDAAKLQTETENADLSKDYWNPNYTKQGAGKYKVFLLTDSSSRSLAKRLMDASGVFNDDEEKIFAVFRELKYKTQISFLASVFTKMYSKDLYTWLKATLNQSELNTVLTITSKLPTGFTKK